MKSLYKTDKKNIFENYNFGKNTKLKTDIDKIFNENINTIDIIVIKSTGGMGGSYLLHALYDKLIELRFDAQIFKSDWWHESERRNIKAAKNKCILFEGFHNIYRKNDDVFISSFHLDLANKIQSGSKIICKINHEYTDNRFFEFINAYRVYEVFLNKMDTNVINNMITEGKINLELELNKEQENIIENFTFTNYRELQAYLLMVKCEITRTNETVSETLMQSVYNRLKKSC